MQPLVTKRVYKQTDIEGIMPPIRQKRKVARVSPFFLGPGTDLEKLKYTPPLNKLDKAAKQRMARNKYGGGVLTGRDR